MVEYPRRIVREVNRQIFIWNSSDPLQEPIYEMPVIEGMDQQMKYHGRARHEIGCHIQEVKGPQAYMQQTI